MKKKILEMYAYYYGSLLPGQFYIKNIDNMGLSRGVIQRGYRDIKNLKLDIRLLEFLYLVDLMYILLIAKECEITQLADIIDLIRNRMNLDTKIHLSTMLIGSKYISEAKTNAEKIIRYAFKMVFEKEINNNDLKLFIKQLTPENVEMDEHIAININYFFNQ